ncbi:hypothetical protein [Lacinutrix algicola]|uniref:hypothetical protein n=1 Tax=Lacinutrix algicola TaxID=342954 RepID=UPI0006E15E43|nr:hypothetical protein [Lacinutrix algicola]
MKKIILLIIACAFMQESFSQKIIKLEYSDYENIEFIEKNNLKEFATLTNNANVGIAYLYPNEISTNTSEKNIKVIIINSKDINSLYRSFDFSNSIKIIIIDIQSPKFNLDTIDCSKLKQFNNLNYIYYRYQFDIDNNYELQDLNCLPENIIQVCSKLFTT